MYVWLAHALVAVGVSTIAWALAALEDTIVAGRAEVVQDLLDRHPKSSSTAWLFYTFSAIGLVLCAACLTIFVGPGANGSGIAEIMGMLNGINYPGAIGFRTLLTKSVGTLLAVSGGLCIGKEGPLAHIGANVGTITAHLPFNGFKCLRNDVIKRQLIAAGASAGVSAAFGAPIGGALFSYEISKPNTFWTFSMLWRVFFASSLATFLLSCYSSLARGTPFSLTDSAALKFGKLEDHESSLLDLPAAVVIGIVTGLLGALFIHVNVNLAMIRKRVVNTTPKKLIEAAAFAFMSSSIFFGIVQWRANICNNYVKATVLEEVVQYRCEGEQYNPLATLIFNTEGGTIRYLLSYPVILKESPEGLANPADSPIPPIDIILYCLAWYFFTITTYGVWVPSGLFLPGILIGCSVGIMYLDVMVYGFNFDINQLGGQTYIIVGASAMLAGYCRLTYSLAVIMLETTQSINNFLPVLLGIGVALVVAKACNRSLYDYAIRSKQMPLLRNHVPKCNENIYVRHILDKMEQEVEVVESVCSVERLSEAIQHDFHSLPVVNFAGKIIGLIPKSFIIILIENHWWYDEEKTYRREEVTSFYQSALKRSTSRQASFRNSTSSPNKNSSVSPSNNDTSEDKAYDSNKNTEENVIEYTHDVTDDKVYANDGDRERAGTMAEFTGEKDLEYAPSDTKVLSWEYFCSDMYSTDRKYSEVKEVCEEYYYKSIDLRPYIIQQPYVVMTTDKLPKCLELFRHMHIRALPVIDPNNGTPVAVLTRQDIFAYMAL